ncbi:hypothetical protein Cgig2_018912 [Carnegiea gigantea]|uniref:NADH-ubiquinone oxidoreductase chain 4 n=1 Tax=Carnegiea gigantea TaxID=171969 RepID=A0A9Q1QDR0_9CARY|nr:hypothetical protein Cgig2_018912 [Carnegiea gigantea]
MLKHFCECYSDLSDLILCPVLGSITLLFILNSRIRSIRLIAKSQFVKSLRWLPYENISFYLGIGGISLFFIILTTFLIPICILVGWSGMRSYGKEYITASLTHEFVMIAVFCMLDLLLLYILSESVSIPMLYVLMLLAILLILLQTGTTDLQILLTTEFSERHQIFLWIAFFAFFIVKVPMVPVHISLPKAHVEAPTVGFIILIDLKKIIAYSSIAHMNFMTIGMFSLNIQGIGDSILLMLSHGLVSSALFLCIGVLYDRHKTRLIRYYGGLVSTMPNFSLIFFFFTLANMSLPGTSSFIG